MSEVRVETASPSFFDLYSRGDASEDDLDAYVGRWHAEYAGHPAYPSLHAYLGLTRDEYAVLLCDPLALTCILRARQTGANLVEVMAERYERLRAANRREDVTILFSLGNWLKRQGWRSHGDRID